jgi:hypothetical protein
MKANWSIILGKQLQIQQEMVNAARLLKAGLSRCGGRRSPAWRCPDLK